MSFNTNVIHSNFDNLYKLVHRRFPVSVIVNDLNRFAAEITRLKAFVNSYDRDNGENVVKISKFRLAVRQLGIALSKVNFE